MSFKLISTHPPPSPSDELQVWRAQILDGILRSVFALLILAFFWGINNVMETYRSHGNLYEDPVRLATNTITLYFIATIIITLITFNRSLSYNLRAGLLLLVVYILGITGLALTSFSGDGRIFLFTFIMLVAVFFDFRFSMIAFVFTFVTLIAMGWLQTSGRLYIPPEVQINASDKSAWVSGTLIFLGLSVASLISITYILRTLEKSLQKTQAAAKKLSHLYAAAEEMTASLPDTHSILRSLAHHLTEALQSTSCNIVSATQNKSVLTVLAENWSEHASASERKSDLGRAYNLEEYSSIITELMNGKPIVIHEDSQGLTEAESVQFKEYGIKSMLFIPIISHGKFLGDAEIWESRYRREFSEEEISLAQAMISHAASIMDNSQLLNQTLQRENELATVLSVVQTVSSSLDLKDVLMQASISMTRILGMEDCILSEYDPQANTIRTIAKYLPKGVPDQFEQVGTLYSLDNYPSTKNILLDGKPVVISANDSQSDPAEVNYLHQINRSLSLCIPLRVHSKPLGLAELYTSNVSHKFSPEEIQLAQALSDQIAIAIENASLYTKLEEREEYFRALIENLTEGVVIVDRTGIVRYIAPSEQRLTGYTVEEIIGQSPFQHIHPDDLPRLTQAFELAAKTPGMEATMEYRLQRKDGQWRQYEVSGRSMVDDPKINGIVMNYRDITERKQAEQAIRESQARFEGVIDTVMNAIITIDSQHQIMIFNPSAERVFGYVARDVVGKNLNILLPERFHQQHPMHVTQYGKTGVSTRAKGLLDVLYGVRANGEEFPMEAFISQNEIGGQKYYTVILQDITERKLSEEALRASERKFRALAENIPSVVYQCLNDERYTFIYLNDAIEALTGYSKKEFIEDGLSFFDLYHPEDLSHIPTNKIHKANAASQSFHITYRIKHKSGDWRWVDEWGSYVQNEDGSIGFIEGVIIDITERKHAEEFMHKRTQELELLAGISQSLRSASNGNEMISILMKSNLQIVGGAYSSIFMIEEHNNFFVSSGWYSSAAGKEKNLYLGKHHPIGEGITGHVFQTGEIYIAKDFQNDPYAIILPEESFLQDVKSGISLPIHSKEKTIGVLHLWLNEQREFSENEIRLLTAVTDMAGNAIDRAALHEQTLRQADELSFAYEKTLAGWARALELRDEPTEGHTRRVTELTLRLANDMGIPKNELIHIQRGATLHDIGKMGIPDSILHKPGPLTEQEWDIMRRHPQYAYDLLSVIPFLRPALDIPLCHHENWDGSGYPRGLKEKEIPLVSRIFSIVDVWDALTSDRPYRPAWSKEKSRQYIQDLSGKKFDPQVVDAFLKMEDL
ncbi:MAG: PAS domain S-box protein [Anaerolineales bacterium]